MASLRSGPVWSILFGWLASGIAVGQDTAEPPTWHEQIGPLLQKHCADCHRPGEPAPFSLLTYDDAFKRRRLIRSVTESGYMPPWLPHLPPRLRTATGLAPKKRTPSTWCSAPS